MAAVPQKVLNWLYSVLTSVRMVFSWTFIPVLTHARSAGIPQRQPNLLRRRPNTSELSYVLSPNRGLQYVI